MRKRLTVVPILLILFMIVFTAGNSFAASIKERMAARIPAITVLKDNGIIGENNKGLLEYRSAQKPDQKTINAENKDRSAVYGAIAKKEGVSATLVGKRRAKRIAEIGQPGHWFQNANGTWYQK